MSTIVRVFPLFFGNIAEVKDIQRTQKGITVAIQNAVGGAEPDLIHFQGTAIAQPSCLVKDYEYNAVSFETPSQVAVKLV
jgi:hypothetical protein